MPKTGEFECQILLGLFNSNSRLKKTNDVNLGKHAHSCHRQEKFEGYLVYMRWKLKFFSSTGRSIETFDIQGIVYSI